MPCFPDYDAFGDCSGRWSPCDANLLAQLDGEGLACGDNAECYYALSAAGFQHECRTGDNWQWQHCTKAQEAERGLTCRDAAFCQFFGPPGYTGTLAGIEDNTAACACPYVRVRRCSRRVRTAARRAAGPCLRARRLRASLRTWCVRCCCHHSSVCNAAPCCRAASSPPRRLQSKAWFDDPAPPC